MIKDTRKVLTRTMRLESGDYVLRYGRTHYGELINERDWKYLHNNIMLIMDDDNECVAGYYNSSFMEMPYFLAFLPESSAPTLFEDMVRSHQHLVLAYCDNSFLIPVCFCYPSSEYAYEDYKFGEEELKTYIRNMPESCSMMYHNLNKIWENPDAIVMDIFRQEIDDGIWDDREG